VPDRITTRTFEIPACGSLLVTERTDEIESVFSEDEVLYCDYDDNLVDMIKQKMADLEEVEDMIMKSMTKVHAHYTWRRLMGELVCEVQK
ncbi:MAG: glycosyltransferase, partial [Planctomycetota bacterium]|nr:glycosyltransferase [Planctomycetota bacterium]